MPDPFIFQIVDVLAAFNPSVTDWRQRQGIHSDAAFLHFEIFRG